MNRETLSASVWRACDIMRRDDGTTGVMEYMEQFSWMLFLKVFEEIEDEIQVKEGGNYTRVIDGPYKWSVWTGRRRRRAELRVTEARNTLAKAKTSLDRITHPRQRAASSDGSNTSFPPSETKQLAPEFEAAVNALRKANINVQQAEEFLASEIVALEKEVSQLLDDAHVERYVQQSIQRQFNGRLKPTDKQLASLRASELERGRKLAKSLVTGLGNEDLLSFVDNDLFPHLRNIQGSPNKDTIGSIFREVSGNRMRSAVNLRAVIDLLDEIDYSQQEDTQIVSQIYEELLSRLGTESGIAGEFYTPRPIIRFMVNIIDPVIGETVFDPFCGSAGFLVEAYKHLVNEKVSDVEMKVLQECTFYGQEKKPLPTLLAVMNMILHGVLTPNISRVNSLEFEDVKVSNSEKRYDIVLTNPPFGGLEGVHVQGNFPVKGSATELLSMQYIIAKIKPGGKCGVVVPEGFLSRTDDAFASVKERLLREFDLYAVVSLPFGVFANATSTGVGPKTDILFFEHGRATQKTLYYEVSQVGYTLTKAQRTISENDLPRAAVVIQDYRNALKQSLDAQLDEYSWIVTIEEIKNRKYDLSFRNPNRTTEDYSGFSTQALLVELLAKHQSLGQILEEIQEWVLADSDDLKQGSS